MSYKIQIAADVLQYEAVVLEHRLTSLIR